MQIKLIITFTILAILLDIYIYKRIAKTGYKLPKFIYLASIILIDGTMVVALLFYHRFSNIESQAYMLMITWVILLFFVSIIPKMVYTFFSFIDYPIQWVTKKRAHLFKRIGIICAFAVLIIMVWGATEGRSRIVTNELEIESKKIPESFDGYRVVMFSDLHIGNLGKSNTLAERMVEKINALDPDMVINGGDLVNMDARELDDKYKTILSRIKAKDGVHSALGNHDLGVYMRHPTMSPEENLEILYEEYRELGWRLMHNETEYIKRGNDSIAITGIDYPLTGFSSRNKEYKGDNIADALDGVTDSTYNIMISHTPLKWDEILEYGVSDLTVAGHVHAMQFKIGLGKYKWSPAKFIYPRWSGLYTEDGRHLYVNDGMGYVMYPMRINAYPELTLFVLKRKHP